MEKIIAFLVSVGFGIAISIVIWIGQFIVSWGKGDNWSFWVSVCHFLLILIPLCVAIPVMGHFLVRVKHLTSSIKWVTSVLLAIGVPFIIFYFNGLLVSRGVHSWLLIRQQLIWTVYAIPVSLILSRLVLELYFKLLDRLGLLDYFQSEK